MIPLSVATTYPNPPRAPKFRLSLQVCFRQRIGPSQESQPLRSSSSISVPWTPIPTTTTGRSAPLEQPSHVRPTGDARLPGHGLPYSPTPRARTRGHHLYQPQPPTGPTTPPARPTPPQPPGPAYDHHHPKTPTFPAQPHTSHPLRTSQPLVKPASRRLQEPGSARLKAKTPQTTQPPKHHTPPTPNNITKNHKNQENQGQRHKNR